MTSHPSVTSVLNEDEFHELAALDTCAVTNAIEQFHVQLRNEGYTEAGIVCRFPDLPPLLGYAMTLHVRTASPPTQGGAYFESTGWWDQLLALPHPRILVIQDMDRNAGSGALAGEVHAHLLKSLGCVGLVTNGAVRDLPQVAPTGFHFFSGALCVSHAYCHIVRAGATVQIGGLEIAPGDLLHGDCHGIVRVPKALAPRIVRTARALRRRESEIIRYCTSPEFTPDGARTLLEGA